MNLNSNDKFLEQILKTLTDRFGVDLVQKSFDRLIESLKKDVSPSHKEPNNKPTRVKRESVLDIIDSYKESDIEKYTILTEFYNKLKNIVLLREAEDIRYFTHLIGMKDIPGKSRKELISNLIRFLTTINSNELREMIMKSENISSRQRQSGFSILTDRLLRDN